MENEKAVKERNVTSSYLNGKKTNYEILFETIENYLHHSGQQTAWETYANSKKIAKGDRKNGRNDLNSAKDLTEVYLNFVKHSQNRSQGGFVDLFKLERSSNPTDQQLLQAIESILKNYYAQTSGNYDFVSLFQRFLTSQETKNYLNPLQPGSVDFKSEKDISLLGFAKTSVAIKKYLNDQGFSFQNGKLYRKGNPVEFTGNYAHDMALIKEAEKNIYNIAAPLTLDFFKEQDYISGHELLCKPRHPYAFFLRQADKTSESLARTRRQNHRWVDRGRTASRERGLFA